MIKNARIVGDNYPIAKYNEEPEPRGSAAFTVRAHVLQEIMRNAQRWQRGYVSPESKAREYGDVWDCLLFTPWQWTQRFAVVPAGAPRRPSDRQRNAKKPSPETLAAIEWWDAWVRGNPGEVISNELSGAAHAAVARLGEDQMITDLINDSRKQVLVVAEWHDPRHGIVVPMKALLDLVPPADHPVFGNSIWDGKTTKNASPKSFARDAERYSYHIQAAFYLMLYNAATGEERSDFGHIIQESFAPYEYRTPPPLMSQRFLAMGKLAVQAALDRYCTALVSGVWPGYDASSGKKWPETDCSDWFLNMESIYGPLEDEPEDDEAPAEPEPEDIIP